MPANKFRFNIALVVLSSLPMVCAGQARQSHEQPTGPTRWFLEPATAERIGAQPHTYRLYGSPDSIRLLLTIVNESSETIEFDHATLRREFRMVLNGRVGLYVTWTPDMASSTGRVALNFDREVRLGAGGAASWEIDARREDGQRFAAGEQVITATMNNALRTLRSPGGHPVHTAPARDSSRLRAPGASAQALTLRVGPPSGPRERADDLRSRAERIGTAKPSEAIRLLHLAQALDPASLKIQLALGQAYLDVERYTESLPFFERALAMQKNAHRSSIPYSLAFVYVALGNDAEARRVLHAGGVSEQGIENNLTLYRRKLGRR